MEDDILSLIRELKFTKPFSDNIAPNIYWFFAVNCKNSKKHNAYVSSRIEYFHTIIVRNKTYMIPSKIDILVHPLFDQYENEKEEESEQDYKDILYAPISKEDLNNLNISDDVMNILNECSFDPIDHLNINVGMNDSDFSSMLAILSPVNSHEEVYSPAETQNVETSDCKKSPSDIYDDEDDTIIDVVDLIENNIQSTNTNVKKSSDVNENIIEIKKIVDDLETAIKHKPLDFLQKSKNISSEWVTTNTHTLPGSSNYYMNEKVRIKHLILLT